MTILPKAILKAIYRFNAIPIKRSMALFIELGKKVLICMEIQKTLKSQSNPEGEKSTGRIRFPHLRRYYKVSVIKLYGTGTKTDILINETGQRVQK